MRSNIPGARRHIIALIISPTGSGKTLTAFLWSLDSLFRELAATPEPEPRSREKTDYVPGIRVVYVSPLKALNNDVERNLRVPLAGIRAVATATGEPAARAPGRRPHRRHPRLRSPEDGPPAAARPHHHARVALPDAHLGPRPRDLPHDAHRHRRRDPHARRHEARRASGRLAGAAGASIRDVRLQRIGLSATVRPVETAARFLGGQSPTADHAERPVAIVDARYPKPLDLRVVMPIERFHEMPGNSFWNAIIPEVSREIDDHSTTLVFCNSRRTAERTSDRLNEHRLRERTGDEQAQTRRPSRRRRPRHLRGGHRLAPARSGRDRADPRSPRQHEQARPPRHGAGAEGGPTARRSSARRHSSSASTSATSTSWSHLQSPKSVASGLQRVGRSGHGVGQTSVGRVYPTHVDDLMEAACVCRGMLRGDIESTETPENPLDVLAQQIVAMVSVEDWAPADLLALLRGAYPFRNLSEPVFRGVLEMISGRYPESVSRYLRPLISWDRVNDRLTALPGSSPLAIGSGGTIPDRGTYALVLGDRRTRIGDLDEEFVFETRPGDTFLLGSNVWRVTKIEDDRVVAEPAPGEIPRMPFWRGDALWRPYDLGLRVGAFRREVAGLVRDLTEDDLATLRALSEESMVAACADAPSDDDATSAELRHLLRLLVRECALDRNSVLQLVEHVAGRLEAAGQLASDRAVVVELFADAIGEPRMVLHSPFGGRVNGPWGIVLTAALRERYGIDAQVIANDDGILFRFASAEVEPPTDLVASVTAAEARERLLAELPHSATFGAQFRMNAARALAPAARARRASGRRSGSRASARRTCSRPCRASATSP